MNTKEKTNALSLHKAENCEADNLPPRDFLRERFVYFPAEGVLRWKEMPRNHFPSQRSFLAWNTRYAGKTAGAFVTSRDGKRRHIALCLLFAGEKCVYYAHRIIMKMMNGMISDGLLVDHKNGDPFDNRYENLRLATNRQNLCNQRPKARILPKGVTVKRKRFASQIKVGGKQRFLGSFATPELAHEAYAVAATKGFGEFACSEQRPH